MRGGDESGAPAGSLAWESAVKSVAGDGIPGHGKQTVAALRHMTRHYKSGHARVPEAGRGWV